jgi:hypothetical protein
MPIEITILLGLAIVAAAYLGWRALAQQHARLCNALEQTNDSIREHRQEERDAARDETRLARAHREPAIHERVTASLTNNEGGIEGVITEYLPNDLRFEDVKFLAAGKPPETVAGSILVPRDRILLLQVHRG